MLPGFAEGKPKTQVDDEAPGTVLDIVCMKDLIFLRRVGFTILWRIDVIFIMFMRFCKLWMFSAILLLNQVHDFLHT